MNSHAPPYSHYNRAFLIGVILNVAFVIVEGVYGVLADSLALIADAGHNLSDVLGLLLAWGASYLAQRRQTPRRTYGWRRATIYAALLNGVILYLAVGGIAVEALRRLTSPAPAAGKTIMIVAALGVGINTLTALMFMAGRKQDLNIRGAFLHMAADAGVSLGVVIAGAAIVFTGWLWLDPALSLVIVLVILVGTWGLIRDSANLALDAVPREIDPHEVRQYLESLSGVQEVHDLHIWAMSTTETALTAHLVQQGAQDLHDLTLKAAKQLQERFNIGHSTLQWERPPAEEAGRLCPLNPGGGDCRPHPAARDLQENPSPRSPPKSDIPQGTAPQSDTGDTPHE